MTQVATHQVIIQNVAKAYPTADEPLRVLTDVSLKMSGGDSLAVVGPSGSGKSTLLQILGTLDRPDSGTVSIDGEDPFRLSEQQLASFRNRKIGFIFQDHHLLPQLSLIENVLVPALAAGKPDSNQLERAKDLIESVGLADRMGHLPSELSGGERERVAIARALLMQPSMILADEPTGNLDRRTADAITDVLLDLQKKSNAILVAVTHSESLAGAMSDKRQLIDGKLVS
jgi:lipoprotein-releasing system ATP-binding protein